MTNSYMKQWANVASNDYIQFEHVPCIASIDDCYGTTIIDDIKQHISIEDEGPLNFDDWLVECLIHKPN